MYFTHHFSNGETLSRARSWLTRLGVAPERIEAHTDGVPRLSLAVAPGEWAGVEMLISAVERSDPQGWPSFHDVAKLAHVYPDPHRKAVVDHPTPGRSVVGWHPVDALASRVAPETGSVADFVGRKWGWD